MIMSKNNHRDPPIHPGELLKEEFLEPMGLTPYRLAKSIQVPVGRITAILKGQRAITADTARRLGVFFDVDPRWFLNMQASYELQCLEDQEPDLAGTITPHSALVEAG